MSIRDKVKRANDLHLVPVRVDAWDLDAFVRRPPARLRDVLESVFAAQESGDIGNHEAMVRSVALCLCDESGALAFDYGEDLDILRDRDSEALIVVFNALLSVIGGDEASAETDEKAGNSESAPASGSDSA